MILIIGSEEEQHSKHVFNALKERKIKAYYFDSRKYTNDILLNYHCGNSDKYNYMVIENKKINLSDIQGVYWRWLYGIP